MKTITKLIIIAAGLFVILVFSVALINNASKKNSALFDSDNLSRGQEAASGKSALMTVPGLASLETGQTSADLVENALPTQADKKIIKSGDLFLRVKKIDDSLESIAKISQDNQGEVFSSNIRISGTNQVKSGNVVVRVPADNFDKAFGELKKVASLVLAESTSGQDVTEQYIDLKSQLKNKQAEETSFLKILDQSGKIDDILLVTKELARVQGEIEVLQGRIRFMDSQTDLSTITVDLTEDANISVIDTWRPWQVIKDSVNSLIKSLQGFVNFVIKFVIQILPIFVLYILLAGAIYWVGLKVFRLFKSEKKTEK